MAKASHSVCSVRAISLSVAQPWPTLRQIRIRTGASLLVAAWGRPPNLRACHGGQAWKADVHPSGDHDSHQEVLRLRADDPRAYQQLWRSEATHRNVREPPGSRRHSCFVAHPAGLAPYAEMAGGRVASMVHRARRGRVPCGSGTRSRQSSWCPTVLALLRRCARPNDHRTLER